MNKKGLSGLTLLFLLFALSMGLAYSTSIEEGLDTNNITQTLAENLRNATNITINATIEESPELANAINYFANGAIRAVGEIGIWVAKFVEQNPHAPYRLLLILLFISILAPIFVTFLKFIVILIILTKEYLQLRKEKRIIKKLKRLEKKRIKNE